MMTPLLAIVLAMAAWKWRQWYDETQEHLNRLQRRIEELERRLK